MKKDISEQHFVYTTGKAITVLANRWFSVLSSVHRFNRKPKDYSINRIHIVDIVDRKIREFQPYQFKDRSYKQVKILSASEPIFILMV